mgnify:CR=1 FL=1
MRALVLAGGYDQIELIKQLKSRGYYVYLADYLDNPPAKLAADEFYRISTLDINGIKKLAEEKRVNIVITACTDQALLTVAVVSKELNLSCYISENTALNVTNKFYMKQILKMYNIKTAKYILLKDNKEINNVDIGGLKYPLVVKPADCNSSKGVVKVDDIDALQTSITSAFELSRSNKVIIEEYIDGVEISVDAWINNNEIIILSITKTIKHGFTIYSSVYDFNFMKKYMDKVKLILEKIASAFELNNIPILLQAIIAKEDIYVIEFSTRIGGGTKYKLIEYISNINIMKVFVDRVLENKTEKLIPKYNLNSCELDYIYADSGKITYLKNFELLKNKKIIVDYYFYKSLKNEIYSKKISSDRVAGILISSNDKNKLVDIRKKVFSTIKILDGDKNILYDYFEKI